MSLSINPHLDAGTGARSPSSAHCVVMAPRGIPATSPTTHLRGGDLNGNLLGPTTGDAECEPADDTAGHATADDQRSMVEDLTKALAVKFDELSLVYRLSESLEVDDDIARGCLELVEQLHCCVEAQLVIIDLQPDEDAGFEARRIHSIKDSVSFDDKRINAIVQFARQNVSPSASNRHLPTACSHCDIEGSGQHHLLVTQLERRSQLLGQFIIVRSSDAGNFSPVEADLLKSTSMLLGVHLMNQRQYLQMQQMFDGMIASLISALDAKDAYTCGHSNRVADLAVELAKRLGCSDDELKNIHMAGMLHDVGKIGVDDSVLRKPGRLTAEEFEQIKQHPVLGYEILRGIRQFRAILPAVRHHHESFDGGGYPDGLAGAAIPREAQILAVADSFDAMTSDRPYRAGMSLDRVVKIFLEGRGQQWAADVVDVLLNSPEVMYQYSLKDQDLVDAKGGCP